MRITVACLALVTFLWPVVSRGDKDVWCRLNESCLLQANFTVGQDVVIHWQKKLKEDIYVHSYYYSVDQLVLQDKQFKNRTSLFKEHIKDGNSSLLLKKVVAADEGRYMCYVGTISGKTESFIKLHVEAAVTTINIQQDGNNLTCSSSGIYPKPQLTWSTEPLLPHALQNATKVDNGTGETLYSISGWLVVAGDNTSQVDYICHVRSHSSRRLTWKNGSTVSFSGSETVINCPFLTGERSIVWMFNNRTIVKMSDGAKNISEEWKEQMKDVSTSGSLSLHSLSSDHEGRYTCQVDNATETRVINFFLSVAGVSHSTSYWWFLLVGPVVGFSYRKYKSRDVRQGELRVRLTVCFAVRKCIQESQE
ncbi:CD276 antigen-like [Entelurus aequoreus]|uniref:CD276 antigen-like n=1 Tax=Entelurus aequoreus TaxID=161455 RepID=UPI002B1D9C00|nr:CD276 antigen-like [Entelurus aequoreus]